MGVNLKPLADRVVVEPAPAEEKSSGGIILPDTAQEKQQGTVVALGPGKVNDSGSLIEMTVKKNDKILYGKYSGSEVNIEGTDYIIMRENDILAVL